ncbi:VWA domain-containing protein [Marinimicrobium sp. ABcell2]|uniref:RCC1 domain-containing protein n=1 Tax=Marinimicrobium sp. ABcell2 TaxID=3069751 RepID=UPI0027AF02EB|nr:VWA domain-containing protein [Marinimicrobium sp. ABcell2]MDQ2076682.1 VWA domain-containing protein [Marinimicrobium sp. ABcell2]
MRILNVGVLALVLGLVACGGGGSGDTKNPGSSSSSSSSNSSSSSSANSSDGGSSSSSASASYTVSTNPGSRVTMEPASASISDGGTASFTVTTEVGYRVSSIAGCGGDFDATTGIYTTGAVTSDCTVWADAQLAVNLVPYTITATTPSIITMIQQVVDRATGEPITTLVVDDFLVEENDEPIAPREAFLDLEPIENIPYELKTVLMLDVSASLTASDLVQVKAAAVRIVESIKDYQQVAVYVFDDTVRTVIGFTSDAEALTNAIEGITRGGPSTNLYGAVAFGFSRWSNSFSLEQVTQGTLILITDGNDTAASSTLEAALTAKGDREFFALTVGDDINLDPLVQIALGRDLETVSQADRSLAARRLLNVTDYSEVDAGLQQIAAEMERLTQGLYFLYYATPKRAGTHSVRVTIADNAWCTSAEPNCTRALNGTFTADGFSNVTPELVLTHPAPLLVPGGSYALSARVRWDTPPFNFTWSLNNPDGQMDLLADPMDSSKATLEVAPGIQLSRATVVAQVMELPDLHEEVEFVAGIPLSGPEGLIDIEAKIRLSTAAPTLLLTADIDCERCIWSVDDTSIAMLDTDVGQSVTLESSINLGLTTLTVWDPDSGLSTDYSVEAGFIVDTSVRAGVIANSTYTLALNSDGSLWSWGSNSNGQLVHGDTINRISPERARTIQKGASVATGGSYTFILDPDGRLWAVGRNNAGQLGLGDTTNRTNLERVGVSSDWASVSAGSLHTLGIKLDGSLWAWGRNNSGQLGLGDFIDRTSPERIGTDNDWASVTIGSNSSLGIKSDGSLWAWGNSEHGQLGLGEVVNQSTPQRVGTANDWEQVISGGAHVLAIKADGSLWVWGLNNSGQLGLGDFTNRTSPERLGTSNDWMDAAANGQLTAAIKSDGSLWAWGSNNFGQLGLGHYSNRSSPERVGTASDWVSVTVSATHALAVKSDGSLWAWGRNGSGQLGLGDTVDRTSPVPVDSPLID